MEISRQLFTTLLAISIARTIIAHDVVLKFCLNGTEIIAKADSKVVDDGVRFEIRDQIMFEWVGEDFKETNVSALNTKICEVLATDATDKRSFTRSYLIAVTEFIQVIDVEKMAKAKWTSWHLPSRNHIFKSDVLTILTTEHISSCSIAFLEIPHLAHESRKLTDYAFMLGPKQDYPDGFPKIDETFHGNEILLLNEAQLGTQYKTIKNGIMNHDNAGKSGPTDVFISPSMKFPLDSLYWRRIINPRIIYTDPNWTVVEFQISSKPRAVIKFTLKDGTGTEIEVEGDVIQHEYRDQLYIQQADKFTTEESNDEDNVTVEPSNFTCGMPISIYTEDDEEDEEGGEHESGGEEEDEDSDEHRSGGEEEEADHSEGHQDNWASYTIKNVLSGEGWPMIIELE